MKLGLHVNNFTWPNGASKLGADLAGVGRAAEDAGFEYLSVMDHFFQIAHNGPPEADMLEAYTTLGYIAGHTSRIKLLTVVTGVLYRQPGLLAKAVTTLDVLSGGRAILGIGAGWNEEESRGLGIPFPSLKERFELLEDALRYILQMWSDNDKPFAGQHVNAERLLNVPQALQKPHPPIMIGGGGEKKTLRFLAKYGQMSNLFNGPELTRKLDILKQHCENEGRDYNDITKVAHGRFDIGENGEKSGELIDELGRLAGLGIDATFGSLVGLPNPVLFEKFKTEIIPAAEAL
jgi:F420-dependent oxidoreductase-like protein